MTATPPLKRGRGRPSQGGPTKGRHLRSGQVWDALAAYYEARGETMSAVVNRLLEAEAQRLRDAGEMNAVVTPTRE